MVAASSPRSGATLFPHRLTLGVDEAGRGPVIGPMVLAVVCLDTGGARRLSRAGVRDSKSFGPPEIAQRIRTELAARIRAIAVHVELHVVDVDEIDRRVRRRELNVLEREIAGVLIERAPRADRIVADGRRLFDVLRARYDHLEAHDRGESHHCAVAAASIIAKVHRDELFADIAARYAPVFGPVAGGGYVNAATRRFLRAYVERYGRLPPEARRSWPHDHLHDLLGPDFDPFAEPPPAPPSA
jgi:ribonuclease HII